MVKTTMSVELGIPASLVCPAAAEQLYLDDVV
jgi:hypothetical protein